MRSKITYRINHPITLDQMNALYQACALGERRPLDNKEHMRKMRDNANLIITAWYEDNLVGIARALSDFSFVTYLADLAVHQDYQKEGIGKRLIKHLRSQVEPDCKIVLLAAPSAIGYYPYLGFTQPPQAWVLSDK